VAEVAAAQPAGPLLRAVAVVTVAVVAGQPLQRGPGALPVAPAAGCLPSRFGTQQPAGVDLVASPGGRGVALHALWPAGTLAAAAVAGAAARPSQATLPQACFAGLWWSRP
jgi:hypothetical protein